MFSFRFLKLKTVKLGCRDVPQVPCCLFSFLRTTLVLTFYLERNTYFQPTSQK